MVTDTATGRVCVALFTLNDVEYVPAVIVDVANVSVSGAEFVPLAGDTFSQLATGATIDHFTDLPAPLATCTVWLAAFCPTVA
jgi:hypothetical protein